MIGNISNLQDYWDQVGRSGKTGFVREGDRTDSSKEQSKLNDKAKVKEDKYREVLKASSKRGDVSAERCPGHDLVKLGERRKFWDKMCHPDCSDGADEVRQDERETLVDEERVDRQRLFWKDLESGLGKKSHIGRKNGKKLVGGNVDKMKRVWQDITDAEVDKKLARVRENQKLLERLRFQSTGIEVDEMRRLWEDDVEARNGRLGSALSGMQNDRFWEDEASGSHFQSDSVTDIEVLCKAIHLCGDDEEDGGGEGEKTITFQKLAQAFSRDKLAAALVEGRKYEIIDYDGEVENFEAGTIIRMKYTMEEVTAAFGRMRKKNPELYQRHLCNERNTDTPSDVSLDASSEASCDASSDASLDVSSSNND